MEGKTLKRGCSVHFKGARYLGNRPKKAFVHQEIIDELKIADKKIWIEDEPEQDEPEDTEKYLIDNMSNDPDTE